jgi:hypothetical protein
MSIVACVKVYDGLVLGADSATNIFGTAPDGTPAVIKTFRNARKLFQAQDLPIGILTYGIGNIGEKSIETLLRDFDKDHTYKNPIPVVDFVTEILNFFKNKYEEIYAKVQPNNKPVLGFYIAGYSPESTLGEEYEFLLPRDQNAKKVRDNNMFGSSWRGISLPFTRLYFGFDPRIKEVITKAGIDPTLFEELVKPFKSPVIYNGMPLQDAVNFTQFILRTTIGMADFEVGPPSCSEPIDIAVINSKKLFTWVKEKHLTL